jgi:hypothetical protein
MHSEADHGNMSRYVPTVAADLSEYLYGTDVRPIGSARPFLTSISIMRLTATLVAALAKAASSPCTTSR